ncbi:uncharacterized protein EAF01_007721 [Botrytis porri]|uniref:Zn(2)-C6 fungal-type domain-containing protein n=1 Tax=Botrytis porri TaxID=87229 RepID=A0A4Z1KN58_9HELO|nr:uncharacterized protein EAF01_007721 [Botrytis porri]KAF7900419.1 hypothetical protein EAF01_007721 [Botrytis porri]TGO85064.1 hypothetical protein BPOR_0435g00070 [Botrytis porri]
MFLVITPPPQLKRDPITGEETSIPLRKRRGLPKVHSGCTTCKTRRIKCDEGNPECNRCRIFYKGTSQKCSYLTREIPKSRVAIRTILPKEVANSIGQSLFSHGPINSVSDITFESPRHFQYFRFFCSDVTTQVFGGFYSELWSCVILQACHEEPCILQAVCAIGALSRVMKARKQGHLMTMNDDYRFAIQEYGKALGGIKKLIPIRMTLLATLLIFSFENFHGNQMAAITQIQSAASLLQAWMKGREKRQITDQTISPAPNIIEDAIFATFHSTHIGLVSAIDPTIAQAQDIIHGTQMYIPSLIPTRFTSIDNAGANFTAICKQVISFLMSTVTLIRGGEEPTEDKISDSAIWNHRMLDWSPAAVEFKEILNKLDQWHIAFEPLAARVREEDAEIMRTRVLGAHWLTTRNSFHSAFFPHTPAHFYQGSFEEVVEICKIVAAHPNFEKGFVFHAGIIPSLMAAAMFGVSSTRKKAIKVLLDIVPRREGNWDAAICARNAIAALKMEYDKSRQATRETNKVVEDV